MKSNGAELLSQCLTAFFTPLINLINAYRGDVIKFSGDALMIYFPAVDDTLGARSRMQVPPHGSFGLPDLGPMATAVLRASACCIEIHKRLHMFDTGVDGVRLCLHIGLGCGEVTILQVGGVVPPETHVPRCEYIIAGPPLEQISIAEPLAKEGETCLSPQAWEFIEDCVIEDTSRMLEDRPDFRLLLKMDETKYTFPTVKYSAMERDCRHLMQFKLSELNVIRRYIPSAVFKQIEGGTLTYVNEMRNISTIFISGSGVDVSTDEGAVVAQELMSTIQRICYSYEGTLNKFVIDDKGMLFLLVYGLPPLVHTDDPTRAVLACFDMIKVFKRLGLTGRFGVTTGRAYCGVCGSAQRMEYTVLGDTVNLSARLMANAEEHSILVDEATRDRCTREVNFKTLTAIKVKGKANAINIFQPSQEEAPKHIGLDPTGRVHFPWYERPRGMTQAPLSAEALSQELKHNVMQLCSLPNWQGINKVQSLLGGQFSADLHRKPSCVPSRNARRKEPPVVPSNSPFSQGGVVVMEGNAGMGKIELAEHMVLYTAEHLATLPIFGTIGPRISDLDKLGVELIRSAVAVARHMDSQLPQDDLEALRSLIPPEYQQDLDAVHEAFAGEAEQERRVLLLEQLCDIAVILISSLRKSTSLIIVLQLEYGTNLFPKTLEQFRPFWKVVSALHKIAMPEGGLNSNSGDKPVVLTLLVKEADMNHPTVKTCLQKGWFVELPPLTEDNCTDYMAMHLKASKSMVPKTLEHFIEKVSLGNPLFLRETIDQLLVHEHIKVHLNQDGAAESIENNQDLEGINIASWGQTAMVGETVCLLESLDPLQAAVLKMSTVFTGAFSLPDLASSSCSRWAGATHFDYLRLFRALQDLVKRGIIEIPKNPALEQRINQQQTFEMRNVLIRKVGGSMVLEAQKKVVKRQALIDRALSRDLPARMEEVYTKRLEPHIPWYYENVLADTQGQKNYPRPPEA